MTITKKEKILIFVLILFLLIGGIYVLGIMPKNNEIKTLEESGATVEADIASVETQIAAVSNSKYNQLVSEIEQNKKVLASYSSATNNVYEEVLPSNLPGHSDTLEITNTLVNFFGEMGLTSAIKVGSPTTTSSKKVYTVTCAYTCERSVLYTVVDEVARWQSFNITTLTMTETDDGLVTGAFAMTLTYVIAE